MLFLTFLSLDKGVSLRPKDWYPQPHWHCWIWSCGINETWETRVLQSYWDWGIRKLQTITSNILAMRSQTEFKPKYTISRHCPFNPNPHCFIAITKATACGCKKPLLPHPLRTALWGEGGCYWTSTALKICFIKTWVTLKLSSKAHWKWRL
jgi:hypothetical protein